MAWYRIGDKLLSKPLMIHFAGTWQIVFLVDSSIVTPLWWWMSVTMVADKLWFLFHPVSVGSLGETIPGLHIDWLPWFPGDRANVCECVYASVQVSDIHFLYSVSVQEDMAKIGCLFQHFLRYSSSMTRSISWLMMPWLLRRQVISSHVIKYAG